MTNIVSSHIYKVTVKYFDVKENKEISSELIYPHTSIKKLDTLEVLAIYLKEHVFEGMVEKLIARDYYKDKGYTKEDFEYRDMSVRYVGQERWWLSWFCHTSNSTFSSEAEAFEDFQKFLEEKGVHVHWSSDSYEYASQGGYCAMGGEDRYRWELCTCEDCIRIGQTVIKH